MSKKSTNLKKGDERMDTPQLYMLPKLAYGYDELAPTISETLLRLHHEKHHASYVNGANAIIEKMGKASTENAGFDTKATFKELSFHIGGHVLHSLFWGNLAPQGKGGGERPSGAIAKILIEAFGAIDRFKKLFSQAAVSTEGSGWAALTYCKATNRPIIMQVEKHNNHIYPMFGILMVLDVWEHAYYLDYQNDRGKFVEAFWNIVNWAEVNRRLEDAMKG
ncbi:superoxide dismutase [Desulfatitalea alkaliphila]|uniref:Superoxide dismutase n=1 Tax=Desulfatitalea alkaliphila TaxID=2929485 RepID=A0AA41R330_9BACT|nr:superoxide dismutase [Desulfatitalea alkaliphila]MCJ8499811.1 superoxide dismutase [Desulfatitalea alkaliphila]